MPSSHLVNLIKDFNVTPNWEHIPLPQGIIHAPKRNQSFADQYQG
jgi:hypothetical protein